ncbi:MAG: hypothetical protein WDW38_004775 [Sanguina aurantia]
MLDRVLGLLATVAEELNAAQDKFEAYVQEGGLRLLHERGGMEVEGSGSVDENATHPSAQHAGCKWGAFTCGQKLRDGSTPRRGKEERDRERVAAAAAAAELTSQLAASG